VCGIKYNEAFPAYEHFILSPMPDKRLGFASARIDTPNGEILSEWYIEGDTVRYHFVVPRGATATLNIGKNIEQLIEGHYTRYSDIK
jgi:alpha-L-rhamnosidase